MSIEPANELILKVTNITEEGEDGEWTIGPEKFAEGQHPAVLAGPAQAAGRLYRAGTDIYFDGEIEAALKLECSRCLENFEYEIDGPVSAVFMPQDEGKTKGEANLESEDHDVQFYEGDELDLFPPLRDHVALATPMKPLCSGDCRGLCPTCGANLNEETCQCAEDQADPRFAELKKLITKQENSDAST